MIDFDLIAAIGGILLLGSCSILGWLEALSARRAFANEVTEHNHTRRRLEDVEALRKGANICFKPPAGWRCIRAAGHDGPCVAGPDQFINREPTIIETHLGDIPQMGWFDEYGRERG